MTNLSFVPELEINKTFISGANYASQNEQVIHVGLGEATKVDKFEVFWANGQTDIFPVSAVNKLTIIKQGERIK